MWHHDVEHDVLDQFAPWAGPFMRTRARWQPVSCRLEGGELALHYYKVHKMNHWVAGCHVPGYAAFTGVSVGANVNAFVGMYRRLNVKIQPTITDGNCGIDVCCLMLG